MARHLLLQMQDNRIMKLEPIAQIKARSKGKPLTFGDFVAGVYQTWGKRRAKGIIKLALAAHMVEFRGTEHFTIS